MNQSPLHLRAGFVACAVAVAMLAACSKDKPVDHVAKAKELIVKQDHRGAVIELKNALQINANSAEARFLLGRELMVQGDAKNAEIELQKAYDQKYDPDAVLPLLVKSQLLQGQPDKVTRAIASGQVKSPAANAELQTLLGVALFGQGKADEAMAAFAAAKKFVPDYPEAQLGEARIMASRGNLDAAKAQVDEVLAKNPKQSEGLLLNGDLLRAKGSTKEAIVAYQAALNENPRNFLARLNMASAYIAAGNLDEAQKQIDELKKQTPRHPGVTYLDALIAFNKKDYARANDAVTISLAGAPGSSMAQMLAGAVSTALNQPAQAEQHLREAIKIAPGSIYARKLLTSLYLKQRQPAKADEVLQPALQAAPNDAVLTSLAGEVALLKGDFPNASKYFDKAGKMNPADANVRTQGAAVEFARGDEAAGFAELEAASKASVNNPNPDIALVLARVQRKQFDQALIAWKVLEKRQPDNPLTYNLRAAIDMGKNDIPAARKSLERAVVLQPTYFPAVANLAALDLRDKNVDGARQRYKQLIAKEPGNLSALLALAQVENANGGSMETVVGLLKEARRTNPTSEQAVAALSSYYATKNDPKQALAVAQEGLASSPNSPRYLDMVGQLMLTTGSADQAIAAYRKLAATNPESLEYQIRLGQAQLAAGQSEVALQTFGNALKTKPDAYPAQATAIGSMLRAGKSDEAARLYADVKQISPKSPVLPELDGDIKFSRKQYADASATYRKLLAQAPSSNVVVKNYTALALDNKRAEADAFLADWIKGHPKDLPVRLFDADMALRAKDYGRATQSYRAALELQPNDALLMNNLAWAMWQQKDPQAIAYAQKASALAPNNPAVSDTLGWMLVEQGETKKGLELLEKASAGAPLQRDIALHLAKAQLKDGRKEAARTTLQALVKMAPDSAEGKESKELMATL
ncbi:MAG: XrtA/PEP-CTERM system TPR-repeat protein PrsT [Burkholderiaceae bacterium]